VQRFRVQDAWLAYEDKVMPVSSFTVSYTLDEFPVAEVVPALGRGLFTGRRALLSELKEAEAVQLWIRIDDQPINLISGFVSHINASDNSTMESRRLSATIQIHHNAVKLAGSPSLSFAYSGKMANMLGILSQQVSMSGPFAKARKKDISLISAFWSSLQAETTGPQIAYYPALVLKKIIRDLMEQYSPLIDVDSLVVPFTQANLNSIVPDPFTVVSEIVDSFKDNWLRSNVWTALRQVVDQYLLHIVPFNTGFYIANPLGILKTPVLQISSSEFIHIKATDTGLMTEPVNGVGITAVTRINDKGVPLTSRHIFYPGDPTAVVPANAYYHFRSIPTWLQPLGTTPFGGATGAPNRKNPGAVQGAAAPQNTSESYESAGLRFAKMIYSQLKMRKIAVGLIFPFRTNLMPGTNVAIQNSGAEDMSFLGITVHGMIARTDFICSMIEGGGGQLNTHVQVVNVRNEKDNASLGLPDHPIYKNTWPGIDINGTFISKPATDPIPQTRNTKQRNQRAQVVVLPDGTVIS
jgi:hypothetical protein